jgi:hypothetical protein
MASQDGVVTGSGQIGIDEGAIGVPYKDDRETV